MRILSAAAAGAAFLLIAAAPGGAAEEWRMAEGRHEWTFPRDHGAHRDYRTEWWYFTGQVQAPEGRGFGYQLTFFRVGARKDPGPPGNPWRLRDLYAAHFALTDLEAGKFVYAERISREGPGLARSDGGGMDVRLLDWSLATEGEEIVLQAREGEMELRLHVKPEAAPLLHGSRGLSRKGGKAGQSSWYYSLTDIRSRGEVRTPWTGGPLPVEGWSWFDHEFGSNQLSADQVGWDWFSLRLGDGRRLMLYLLRLRDGGVEPLSSGTLREADGTVRHLSRDDFRVAATGAWRSPKSGAQYPSGWTVQVPSSNIDLVVTPLMRDQELVTARSTGITYWEGAVSGSGRSAGSDVAAEGYVELTGYGGSLGGLF